MPSPYGCCAWPENNCLPSEVFTELALQVLEPSFARDPSTEMTSPVFSEFLFQPRRTSEFGAPPSHCHAATAPLAYFTSK
jgi:hypothetical protein